jgi:hypothetical protein
MLLRWGVNPPSPDPCCCCGWLTPPQPQISYCCCVLRVNLFKKIYKGVSPTSLELCSAVVSCYISDASPVQLLHLSDPVFAKVTKLRRHLLYNLTRSRQTILLHATTVVAAAGAAAAAAAAVVVSCCWWCCCWWCCCCCCRQLLLVVLQLLLLVLLLLLLVLPV